MINLSARATPSTRLRLTYRIRAGQFVGTETARAAAARINERLELLPLQAFVVARATEPQRGGPSGAGLWGLLAAAVGQDDYFTSVDVMTAAQVTAPTWGDVLENAREIPPAGFSSLDTRITLDNVVVISRTDNRAVAPDAQQSAAQSAARTSSANAPSRVLASTLTKGTLALALVAIIAGAGYLWNRRQS